MDINKIVKDNFFLLDVASKEVFNQELKSNKYKELEKNYKGIFKIRKKKNFRNEDFNNKYSINYVKIITEQILGYYATEKVEINYECLEEYPEKNQKIKKNIDYILKMGDFAEVFYVANKNMTLYGKTGIRIKQIDNKTVFSAVKPSNYFKISKDGIVEAFVLYDYKYNEDGDKIYLLEVITDKYVFFLERSYENEKAFVLSSVVKNPVYKHNFNGIPFVEVKNNDESLNDLGTISEQNDNYNLIMSHLLDQIIRERNYFLVFEGINNFNTVNDTGQKDVTKKGLIALPTGGKAYFINVKNENMNNVMDLLKDIEENIYKESTVPNYSDENLMGNARSGKAMGYKIHALEAKCKIKDMYWEKAILRILDIIKPIVYAKTEEKYSIGEFNINFYRNLPYDIDYEDIKITKTMKDMGIFDDRTILEKIKGIDPDTVLGRKQKQDEKQGGFNYDTGHLEHLLKEELIYEDKEEDE